MLILAPSGFAVRHEILCRLMAVLRSITSIDPVRAAVIERLPPGATKTWQIRLSAGVPMCEAGSFVQ